MFPVAMLMPFCLFRLFPFVFVLQFVAVDENSCGVYHAEKAEQIWTNRSSIWIFGTKCDEMELFFMKSLHFLNYFLTFALENSVRYGMPINEMP